MRRLLLLLALVLCAFWAGREGAARAVLRLGLPQLTLALTQDDNLRGLALYRAGRFTEASEAFRLAGARASFNRGNAFAKDGLYREAVGDYDAVLARDPSHADAKANRAIVVKLVDSETERGGGSRPQGTEEGEHNKTQNKNESMTLLQAEEAVRQRAIQVQRPQDHVKALIANEQWLVTLADEPGRYLKLRIAAEYKRRLEEGTAPPPGDDRW